MNYLKKRRKEIQLFQKCKKMNNNNKKKEIV